MRIESVMVMALAFSGCTPKGSGEKQATEPERVGEVVSAPQGPVAEVVRDALATAKADKRRLIVYVGASWCEPCTVFLDGANAGRLTGELADLRVLKFDNDVDDARLTAAGYGGQMIPRFVVPGADGLGTSARFEGSVKGAAAWDNIVPRLQAIAPAH